MRVRDAAELDEEDAEAQRVLQEAQFKLQSQVHYGPCDSDGGTGLAHGGCTGYPKRLATAKAGQPLYTSGGYAL